MKTAIVLAVMLVALSSFPLIAAETGSSPQLTPPQQASPRQSSPDSAQPASPAAGPDVSTADMRPVSGELVGNLDTKTAKTGDSVVVKTRSSVKTADGTEIPKGTKLVGHVTGVQAQGQGSANSQVAIQFDHAELKGGQNLPIHTVIRSVAPAESDLPASQSDAFPGGAMGSTPAGAPATGGGMSGSRPSSGGSAESAPQQSAPPASAGPSPGAVPGSAPGESAGPAVGAVVARSGNIAIRTTAIPGVLIANNDTGQDPRMGASSGILLGAKRDVHLDGGTKVMLGISAENSK